MIKILHCPDLHLYDTEIGQSIGYPEECIKILKTIKEIFVSGDYDLCTLGGDIQHNKINKTYYISKFKNLLREIGESVRLRLEERGLLHKINVYNKEGNLIDLNSYNSILFTVRGQHDSNAREEFTFFDLLLEEKTLINPRIVTVDDLQLNFINYTRDIKALNEEKLDSSNKLISIYHQPIMENGVFVDGLVLKNYIKPDEVGIFNNVDLAVINDIHMPMPIRELVTGYTRTTILTPGSIGRTSFSPSHDRDYANLVHIEYNEGKLFGDYLEIELKPREEFFDKVKIVNKIKNNEFKDFSINLKDVEINYFDAKEEIEKLVEDEEIKQICFKILEL